MEKIHVFLHLYLYLFLKLVPGTGTGVLVQSTVEFDSTWYLTLGTLVQYKKNISGTCYKVQGTRYKY